MTLAVTGMYAAILGLIMIAFQFRVIVKRAKSGISLLDGDDKDLALAMRQHGNFIENVPLALVVMAIAELQGAAGTWLQIIGIVLVVSRIIHPLGLNFEKGATVARIAGAIGTQIAIVLPACLILWPMFGG